MLCVLCVLCVLAGGSLSYTHHTKLMQKLFADLGVETSKLTHELRIFAAQLLYEMGVPLEVRCAVAWLISRHVLT